MYMLDLCDVLVVSFGTGRILVEIYVICEWGNIWMYQYENRWFTLGGVLMGGVNFIA